MGTLSYQDLSGLELEYITCKSSKRSGGGVIYVGRKLQGAKTDRSENA